MEHLGGLVPLLVGRQVNRFLPQFHISLHPADGQVLSTGSSAQVFGFSEAMFSRGFVDHSEDIQWQEFIVATEQEATQSTYVKVCL
ncbi:unnamed protein product [Nippostrongylus brasiliensis]|uniref:Actin-related protein 5 n=1 Tax=Nippostrongylus brasiliensis TaxID=27835 RepID=A0A0N4XHL3_NIPBR|nr:unnamed protein product [Nippostrongylus brasiliensis]